MKTAASLLRSIALLSLVGFAPLLVATPADAAPRKTKKVAAKKKVAKKAAPKKKAAAARDDEALSFDGLDLGDDHPAASSECCAPLPVETAALPAPETQGEASVTREVERKPERLERGWLEVAAGLHVFRRDLTFDTAGSTRAANYALDAAPAPRVEAAFYPAHFAPELPRQLGVGFSFERSVGLVSVAPIQGGTVSYPTATTALTFTPQGKFDFGRASLLAKAGFGYRGFSIDDAPEKAKPRIPSVAFAQLVAAGGARLQLTEQLALDAGLGFRQLLSSGELATDPYFTEAGGQGFTGQVGVAFAYDAFEGRLGLDLERYGLDLKSASGEASATDQYLGLSLTVSYGS